MALWRDRGVSLLQHRMLYPAGTATRDATVHGCGNSPITGLSGEWTVFGTGSLAVFDPGSLDSDHQTFTFDSSGAAHLERYELHENVISFLGKCLVGLFPHQSMPGEP